MTSSSWVIFLIMVAIVGFACYKRGAHNYFERGRLAGYQAAMTDHFNAQMQQKWAGAQTGRMTLDHPMITEVPRAGRPGTVAQIPAADLLASERAEAVSGLVNMGWAAKDCHKPVLQAQTALQARGEAVTTLSLVKEVLKNHASAVQ